MPSTSTKKRRLSSGLGVSSSRWPRWATSMIGSSCIVFLHQGGFSISETYSFEAGGTLRRYNDRLRIWPTGAGFAAASALVLMLSFFRMRRYIGAFLRPRHSPTGADAIAWVALIYSAPGEPVVSLLPASLSPPVIGTVMPRAASSAT